jgi:hypothetical protein
MSVQSSANPRAVTCLRKAKMASIIPLLMFAAKSLGSDDLDLKLENDGIEDVFVTVYDMNTRPYSIILEHGRINGFASVPILATADMAGRASLSWSATSVDSGDPRCGRGMAGGLGIHASISVHVDFTCAGSP